jgi:glucose/arabinose dehydrogenase
VHAPGWLVVILLLLAGCVRIDGGPGTLPGGPGPPPTELPPSTAPTDTPEPTASADPTAEPRRGYAPGRFQLRIMRIADDLAQPVFLTGDGTGSGRLYIVERPGRILVMEDGRIRSRPFLNIRSRVDTRGERGLHAVAFHPRYERNGRVFVHYNDAAGRTRVVEYRARQGAAVARAGSARHILTLRQPEWNHNGGWIGFGPDGYLYIALGDGGGNSPGDPQRNGQRRGTLLAKVLRIDVDGGGRYRVPRDNPYPRGERGFAPETWVWGLRNPWRASFDRETGDLWIGDVGQDRFEEVNLVPAGRSGLNFGWSDMEGNACHLRANCDPKAYAGPVHAYRHGPGCSIIGGYVYRGSRFPDLYGGYLFADFCSGAIWGLDAEAAREGRNPRPRQLLNARWNWASFGEDDDGELYAISLGGGIYRITARSTR